MNTYDLKQSWKEKKSLTEQLELTESELELVEGGKDWSKVVRPAPTYPLFPICPPVIVISISPNGDAITH